MCCDLVVAGGARAPTPVGDLGFVEMTQAVEVAEAEWQQVRVCMHVGVYVCPHTRERSRLCRDDASRGGG